MTRDVTEMWTHLPSGHAHNYLMICPINPSADTAHVTHMSPCNKAKQSTYPAARATCPRPSSPNHATHLVVQQAHELAKQNTYPVAAATKQAHDPAKLIMPLHPAK